MNEEQLALWSARFNERYAHWWCRQYACFLIDIPTKLRLHTQMARNREEAKRIAQGAKND